MPHAPFYNANLFYNARWMISIQVFGAKAYEDLASF